MPMGVFLEDGIQNRGKHGFDPMRGFRQAAFGIQFSM
jgi:hypothetical protein